MRGKGKHGLEGSAHAGVAANESVARSHSETNCGHDQMAYPEYLPRQTLYHYTSVDGFAAIAKSKCLRLSDLAAANDPREIHLGREKVFVALRSVLDEEYKAGGGSKLLHLILRLVGYFDGLQIFCCCLSPTGDSLPMWNAYGANYGGLSIGFRPSAITFMTGRIQKVKYLDETNEGDFRTLALAIAAELQTVRSESDLLPWISSGTSAISAAIALKHDTWSYENEVRLIYVQRRDRPDNTLPVSSGPDGKPVGWRQPSERLAGAETVNYFDFPFGRFQKGAYDPKQAIEYVIIGPKCSLGVNEVDEMLKSEGFDGFTVRPPNCQIR